MTSISNRCCFWMCIFAFICSSIFAGVPGARVKASEIPFSAGPEMEYIYLEVKNNRFVFVERFGNHTEAVFNKWKKISEQRKLPNADPTLGEATALFVIIQSPVKRGENESWEYWVAYQDVIPLSRSANDPQVPLSWVSLNEMRNRLRSLFKGGEK